MKKYTPFLPHDRWIHWYIKCPSTHTPFPQATTDTVQTAIFIAVDCRSYRQDQWHESFLSFLYQPYLFQCRNDTCETVRVIKLLSKSSEHLYTISTQKITTTPLIFSLSIIYTTWQTAAADFHMYASIALRFVEEFACRNELINENVKLGQVAAL